MAGPSGRRWFALAFLLVVALLGIRPTDPRPVGAFRDGEVAMDETLDRLRVFVEAVRRVQEEYYDTTVLDPPDTIVRGAIEGMIEALGDPYSHYLPPEPLRDLTQETQGEFGGLGIMIGIERDRLTVIAPIEGTPADRAGLRPGDVITEIEGESSEGMPLQTAVSKLRGPVGTKVTIHVERGGEALPPITIVRETIQIRSVKWTMLGGGIGVLRIGQFTNQTPGEVDEGLRALAASAPRGMILDLRSNPGGVLQAAVGVADRFIDSGVIVSTRGRTAEQNQTYGASAGADAPRVPLVVLVDTGSASASEIVAGALQDVGRGVLVGTRTFGKGSVQSVRPLPDNSGLALTTALYYTPAGRRIHGVGLEPDLRVEPRAAPRGAEIEALQSDTFREMLTDFAQGRDTFTVVEVKDFARRLADRALEIDAETLEFLVLRELTRRHDRGLYLDTRLDPQLRVAVEILEGRTAVAARPRSAVEPPAPAVSTKPR